MKKHGFDIKEYAEIAGTLDTIAQNYAKSSKEYRAIEAAAKALLFACEKTAFEEFEEFWRQWGKKLSPKQTEHLKKMGLLEEGSKPRSRKRSPNR
jgi:hypothetical protein